jgi:hypothetical protein
MMRIFRAFLCQIFLSATPAAMIINTSR